MGIIKTAAKQLYEIYSLSNTKLIIIQISVSLSIFSLK